MVTTNGSPLIRISSGSSTATGSLRRWAPSGPSRSYRMVAGDAAHGIILTPSPMVAPPEE